MTETHPPYWTEPFTWDFETRVVQKTNLGSNQFEVILEKSYFYPTAGGQSYDTGLVGEARVIDVFRAENGVVVHRVEGEVPGPVVIARIDGARRLGHMQHHSAQHMVSRALEERLGLETLSARISIDSFSTIDVADVEVSRADWQEIERRVNQLVCENRPIKTYFVTQDQLHTVPLRRPPKVTGQIRIVEIDAYDYSACGGTHCPTTGMIGLIKIVKTERKNKKLRLHFAAGQQALTVFQQAHDVLTDLCLGLNTRPEELGRLVNQQMEQLAVAQREIKRLQASMVSFEAEQLSTQAEPIGQVRLVNRLYPNRSIGDLRELAKWLITQDNLVAVLAGHEAEKLSLVIGCAPGTGLSARTLLDRCLAPISGKGSGDERLAQGGGHASAGQAAQILTQARTFLT